MRFLDGIERDRGNSVQTRNARLAAIRSFFRLVTLHEPARLDLAAQVLAIPTKRADRRLIGYLTRPEMSLRKIIKTRGSFPSEEAALKLIYMALRNVIQNGTRCKAGSRR